MTRKFSTKISQFIPELDGTIYTDKNGKVLKTDNHLLSDFIKSEYKHLETSIHNLMNKNPIGTFTELSKS